MPQLFQIVLIASSNYKQVKEAQPQIRGIPLCMLLYILCHNSHLSCLYPLGWASFSLCCSNIGSPPWQRVFSCIKNLVELNGQWRFFHNLLSSVAFIRYHRIIRPHLVETFPPQEGSHLWTISPQILCISHQYLALHSWMYWLLR